MSVSAFIIALLWIVFWFYWMISAARAKRTIRTKGWWHGAAMVRVALIVFIVVLVELRAQDLVLLPGITNPIVRGIGVVLCIAGMAFAVLARVHIGRNWGMPMSRKENPELITTGPYRLVRHPIYSGTLLAILGSAIALRGLWFFVFIFFAIYLIVFAVRKEEELLITEFPNEYSEYKERTKMLIPFVW